MITLENYIMESDISDATVGDIYVEQALAEMEVAYALANSYMKDAMFVEYLAEAEGVDVEVYQEALMTKARKEAYERYGSMPDKLKGMAYKDEKAIKRAEKISSFKENLKEAPGRIWEFLKSAASAIATSITNFWHFITEKSLKACIKRLKELPGDKTHSISAYVKDSYKTVIRESKFFCSTLEAIASGREVGDTKLKEFKDNFTPYLMKRTRENSSVDSETVTTAELIQIFEELDSADTKNEIKAAIKKVKEVKATCDKQAKKFASGTKDKDVKKEYKGDREFSQETLKLIKETSKSLITAYANMIREYRALANKVLKVDKAAYKADKKYHDKLGLAFGDED